MTNVQTIFASIPIALTIVGGLIKYIGHKFDSLAAHLTAQDRRSRRSELRMMRVETKLGLPPLPFDTTE